MEKGLAVVGLVCSVTALLAAMVLVQPAAFLIPVVVIVASVFLFPQRGGWGLLFGMVLLAIGLVVAAGLSSSISTKDSSFSLGIPVTTATALSVAAPLVGVAFIVLVRRDQLAMWAWAGTFAVAALAILLAFINREQLVNQSDKLTLLVGGLCLATVTPFVLLLMRRDDDEPEPAPPMFAPSPVHGVPQGMKPAGPKKEIPTVTAPVKKVPPPPPMPPPPAKKGR